MSSYSFIATNDQMPEIDQTNTKYITVKEAMELGIQSSNIPWEQLDQNAAVLLLEDKDDLNELIISKEAYYGDCGYTTYPFVYEVNFVYSEISSKKLFEYLKENMREGQIVEIWSVWIRNDDELNIPFTRCSYEELSIDHLIQIYNRKHQGYKQESCLVIER